MPAFRDRANERYGRLLVIKHKGKDKRSKHLWECLCDCGNIKVVVSDNLSSGKSKSCGCLKHEFLTSSGYQFKKAPNRPDTILKVQYSHLARRHRKFNGVILSFEEFKTLSASPCFYCGSDPYKILEDRSCETKGKLISDTVVRTSGIDRINNKIGYTSRNSVPCCKICNSAKGELSLAEFVQWAKRLSVHFIGIERDDKYFEIAKKRIEEA